jgi:hypothetical protein
MQANQIMDVLIEAKQLCLDDSGNNLIRSSSSNSLGVVFSGEISYLGVTLKNSIPYELVGLST